MRKPALKIRRVEPTFGVQVAMNIHRVSLIVPLAEQQLAPVVLDMRQVLVEVYSGDVEKDRRQTLIFQQSGVKGINESLDIATRIQIGFFSRFHLHFPHLRCVCHIPRLVTRALSAFPAVVDRYTLAHLTITPQDFSAAGSPVSGIDNLFCQFVSQLDHFFGAMEIEHITRGNRYFDENVGPISGHLIPGNTVLHRFQ